MSETLPAFRYHPDPVATGSVIPSNAECRICGEARGFIYTGPSYGDEGLTDEVCPWCIADGSAHDESDAECSAVSIAGRMAATPTVSNQEYHGQRRRCNRDPE